MNALDQTMFTRMKAELQALDKDPIEVDGKKLRPSQCYRVSSDPGHILFNTNCPDSLRDKVNAILDRYKIHVS
jgi:hypothetical protein